MSTAGPGSPGPPRPPASPGPPQGGTGRAPSQHGGRRRPAVRWIVHGVLLVALTVGIFGLLPHLGGLARDAAGLRQARPAFLVAAVVAEAVSLGCYAQLYRRVLAALGARIRFRLAADVIMATFFVSHLTPFGSATGTLVNASTLESEGIAATTTGEAIALSSLTSTVALLILFGCGFAATAGRHVSHEYLVIAGIALFLVAAVLAAVLAVGARPAIAGRAGSWAASVARHVRHSIDPAKVGQASARLASLARTALTGRDFAVSLSFAAGNWLFDLLALDLVFLALRYQPGFGPLAVAYGAANIASAKNLPPQGQQIDQGQPVRGEFGYQHRCRRRLEHGRPGRHRLNHRRLRQRRIRRRAQQSRAQAVDLRIQVDHGDGAAGGGQLPVVDRGPDHDGVGWAITGGRANGGVSGGGSGFGLRR
jgi:putative heme transporter